MHSNASTPKEYVTSLPEDRRQVIAELRKAIRKNLPEGFSEIMSYGMLCYVIPHSLYPDGYHVDPAQPLPFMAVASQKNFIAIYHMGIYTDKKLLAWFTAQYPKHTAARLDMGKSCIRFSKPDQSPVKLFGELASKITPDQWIEIYEHEIKK